MTRFTNAQRQKIIHRAQLFDKLKIHHFEFCHDKNIRGDSEVNALASKAGVSKEALYLAVEQAEIEEPWIVQFVRSRWATVLFSMLGTLPAWLPLNDIFVILYFYLVLSVLFGLVVIAGRYDETHKALMALGSVLVGSLVISTFLCRLVFSC